MFIWSTHVGAVIVTRAVERPALTMLGFGSGFGLRVCGHDSYQSGGTTRPNNVSFSVMLEAFVRMLKHVSP